MPKDIQFPEVEPRYVFERDCLGFQALADGKPVECMVTGELFMTRFRARDMSEDSLRQAYREHQSEIQSIARDHIENGWLDEDGRVFLTTRFTRLSVTFSEPLASDPHVAAAHRMLTDIIGPNAGAVTVTWTCFAGVNVQERPSVHVSVIDPAISRQRSIAFQSKDWADTTTMRLRLASLWGALLQAQSRNLLLKSG
ncbi:MAG: DUF1488 domain-containing protein [Gemmataceae bacterium]|nr:DUF1488 domain-containing protein [Gemmataceae bacterium]